MFPSSVICLLPDRKIIKSVIFGTVLKILIAVCWNLNIIFMTTWQSVLDQSDDCKNVYVAESMYFFSSHELFLRMNSKKYDGTEANVLTWEYSFTYLKHNIRDLKCFMHFHRAHEHMKASKTKHKFSVLYIVSIAYFLIIYQTSAAFL